ncbi:hypothetical protein RND71_010660 [Anisodus tanguticus]|uniref:Uncharacterized protein n=1 Tax=Anisodus tanguticus TaxID=243964 RepID=A0AAE1VSV4_9SOLA|nr:hypothetical protein RND71_010660 [Anisodus tanguticus]
MASYNGNIHQEGIEKREPTPLEKHVMFFDIDKNGIIYPWETFQGFRKIGSGIFLSIFASFFINFGLSRNTRPGKWPSLLFPIEVKNIKFAKHGSDSGVYDSEGRFVHEKFEEIFKKHARSNGNALTGQELDELLKANREPNDRKGRKKRNLVAVGEGEPENVVTELFGKIEKGKFGDGGFKNLQVGEGKSNKIKKLEGVIERKISSKGGEEGEGRGGGGRGIEKREPTPLEKHVMFFDIDKNGIIYPWETFQGILDLSLLSLWSFFLLLLAGGGATRFVHEKFEEIFKKHARSNGNALTGQELDELLKANREPNDRKGRIAALLEWKILYFLCKDKHGLLGKETIRAVYDGSLFDQMTKEHQSKKKK